MPSRDDIKLLIDIHRGVQDLLLKESKSPFLVRIIELLVMIESGNAGLKILANKRMEEVHSMVVYQELFKLLDTLIVQCAFQETRLWECHVSLLQEANNMLRKIEP